MSHKEVPIGSVIASMFPWPVFKDQLGRHDGDWMPADGSPVPQNTKYYQVLSDAGLDQIILPDLRGRFQRGLNSFQSPGGEIGDELGNPEDEDANGKAFAAGSYQKDDLIRHTHAIPARHGQIGKAWLSTGVDHEAPDSRTRENTGADETRPRNVSLYYYIRVN
ncbi:hypothetical protein [Cognatishimia sp.]|uniref:hypothetical protein n=1 Tax=Cognatishimia sp. TaxID=2211648 RepID=UPI0035154A34